MHVHKAWIYNVWGENIRYMGAGNVGKGMLKFNMYLWQATEPQLKLKRYNLPEYKVTSRVHVHQIAPYSKLDLQTLTLAGVGAKSGNFTQWKWITSLAVTIWCALRVRLFKQTMHKTAFFFTFIYRIEIPFFYRACKKIPKF